jgi:hypothetical protein
MNSTNYSRIGREGGNWEGHHKWNSIGSLFILIRHREMVNEYIYICEITRKFSLTKPIGNNTV